MTVPQVLRQAVESDRLASSYLFYGRSPEEFAGPVKAFLKGMTCTDADGLDYCDNCPNCRQTEKLNHPDVTATGAPGHDGDVDPEDRLGVETVREEIINRASLTPARSAYKLFWLHDLSRFTTEAANTLLKVLEEPPGDAVFLLTTRSRWDCLPTIRSRCQWIRVPREEPSINSLRDRCEYHWESVDDDELDNWLRLLNGELKSHTFQWNRNSSRQFLEFLLFALDEKYRASGNRTDSLMADCPDERLSYSLIPDILQRLEELERGGNPTLVVNSLLEMIFFPGAQDEWVNAM
ncbi:MAG: hypothetical protein ABEH89_00445 [bacterium]